MEQETSQVVEAPSRRSLLKNALVVGAGIGAAVLATGCRDLRVEVQERARSVTGPTPPVWKPLPADAAKVEEAVAVLNRAAFGPKPGDIAKVVEMGTVNWLEEQLKATLPEDPTVTWRVGNLDIQQIGEMDKNELYSQDDNQLVHETGQAALLRATYSTRQLYEVMADFWTNHFNIYALKLEGRSLVPTDTETVIRPNALGKFSDMLKASARSPAMLTYLDNKENVSGVVNENYARELLELHTVGVHGGYTHADIKAIARCFSGWSVGDGFERSDFKFFPDRHDKSAKFIPFLKLHIPASKKDEEGIRDGEIVLEYLAHHPLTGRYLAEKLCERFIGAIHEPLVAKAAEAFVDSRSDIRAMLRPILLEGLTNPTLRKPIVKRPLDFLASSLRALAADTDADERILKHLDAMGQPLYQWPMPDGYPEKSSSWSSVLLPRWNFALALTLNGIEGTKVDLEAPLNAANAKSDDEILDTLLITTLGKRPNHPQVTKLRKQVAGHILRAKKSNTERNQIIAEATALILSSPIYQWKAG